MKKRLCISLLVLTALVCFAVTLTGYLKHIAKVTNLLAEEEAMGLLRQQEVPAGEYESFCDYEADSEYSRYDYLIGGILSGESGIRELDAYLGLLYQYHPQKIREMEKYEKAVWEDLQYFPIPLPREGSRLGTSYENSWMFDRSFGGNRGHEGTDIMASLNQRGQYPVVSMTDGVVEKIGWLKLGGYRIGIRSPHGGYFYYAHLYDYTRDFQEGEEVKAGELLGFMGDSGYGEEEGTVGQFAVHLHVGIYVEGGSGEEMSVNPYWVLKWLEGKRLRYAYG